MDSAEPNENSKHTPEDNSAESPAGSQPDSAQAAARLEEIVSQVEGELSKQKEREEELGTLRESIYMVAFQAFVVFMFGGISEYLAKDIVPARARRSDFMQDRLRDVEGIIAGFGEHLGVFWLMDLMLIAAVALIAFGIKKARPRRRYFSVAVAVSVLIFTVLMFMQLQDMFKPLGM